MTPWPRLRLVAEVAEPPGRGYGWQINTQSSPQPAIGRRAGTEVHFVFDFQPSTPEGREPRTE
ncbi:hypothetical protein ZHAS_00011870 [Anopheles sinensis]|uniref:Uncharacterized protein n=1 Tax=Anopheles sinensis TaxID=74873 RepID=A0A084W1E6_ANOSI|nr:hypothetical protein ZHAS_00011870 [Anopheles sinensis]